MWPNSYGLTKPRSIPTKGVILGWACSSSLLGMPNTNLLLIFFFVHSHWPWLLFLHSPPLVGGSCRRRPGMANSMRRATLIFRTTPFLLVGQGAPISGGCGNDCWPSKDVYETVNVQLGASHRLVPWTHIPDSAQSHVTEHRTVWDSLTVQVQNTSAVVRNFISS